MNWLNGSRLFLKKGMHGATGNYYAHLQDFEEMSFLIHYLSESDFFIDIGANVGAYTVLAGRISQSKVYAFEPVPLTFDNLVKNLEINSLSNNVKAFNVGLSDSDGELFFTQDRDTVNHVTDFQSSNAVKVKVIKLDEFCSSLKILPSVLKIDVEGFELPVLKGGINILANKRLKVVIIELNGSGLRFGFKDLEIDDLLTENGFTKYEYLPFRREMKLVRNLRNDKFNYLYCRDMDFVIARIKEGPYIEVPGFTY